MLGVYCWFGIGFIIALLYLYYHFIESCSFQELLRYMLYTVSELIDIKDVVHCAILGVWYEHGGTFVPHIFHVYFMFI